MVVGQLGLKAQAISESNTFKAGPGMAKAAINGEARVRLLKGQAEYAYDSANWKPLSAGKALEAGATIRTSDKSEVILSVEETGAFLRVSPNSVLALNSVAATEAAMKTSNLQKEKGSATVRAVRGKAEVYTKAAQWEPLKVNTLVTRGSILRTSSGATVDLFFSDKSLVVRMDSDTILRLDQHDFSWDGDSSLIESVLVVPKGRILTNAGQEMSASRYEMKTAQVLYRISEAAGQKR